MGNVVPTVIKIELPFTMTDVDTEVVDVASVSPSLGFVLQQIR